MVALRIYSGSASEFDPQPLDASPAAVHSLDLPPDACLRLREYFERFVAPDLKRRKSPRSTIQTYLTCIARWEQYGRSELKDWTFDRFGRTSWTPRRTGAEPEWISNPPIGLIVDDDLTAFQDTLSAEGFPNTTINTTLSQVMPVLNHAAPRGERGGGRGVLLLRPYCKPLATTETENFIPSEEEVAAFFDATWDARWPDIAPDVPAAYWWQGLIVFLSNYGLGCADWKKICWHEHVLEDCSVLKYVRTKTQKKRPHPVLFEINETTRWYLNRMMSKKRIRTGKPQVFYSGRSRARFEVLWIRLVEKAGVSRKETKKDGKVYELFDRHAMRRFCNQYLNDHCDGQPGEWVLNHAFKGNNAINSKHYSRIYQPPNHVTESLHSVPQLPIFTEIMNAEIETAKAV